MIPSQKSLLDLSNLTHQDRQDRIQASLADETIDPIIKNKRIGHLYMLNGNLEKAVEHYLEGYKVQLGAEETDYESMVQKFISRADSNIENERCGDGLAFCMLILKRKPDSNPEELAAANVRPEEVMRIKKLNKQQEIQMQQKQNEISLLKNKIKSLETKQLPAVDAPPDSNVGKIVEHISKILAERRQQQRNAGMDYPEWEKPHSDEGLFKEILAAFQELIYQNADQLDIIKQLRELVLQDQKLQERNRELQERNRELQERNRELSDENSQLLKSNNELSGNGAITSQFLKKFQEAQLSNQINIRKQLQSLRERNRQLERSQ